MGRKNGRKSYFAKEHKKPKQKKNKKSYIETTPIASSNQNRKQRQVNVTAQSIFAIADEVFGGNIYRHSSDSSD